MKRGLLTHSAPCCSRFSFDISQRSARPFLSTQRARLLPQRCLICAGDRHGVILIERVLMMALRRKKPKARPY